LFDLGFECRSDLSHFYFWNQCRKESDPTYEDSEMEWWISRLIQNRLKMTSLKFRVVLCRIRLFPTLISKIKSLWSELPSTVSSYKGGRIGPTKGLLPIDYWSNWSQRKALYLDQIHENMKDEKAMEILDQPLNEDKAGQGQNYCIHCE